MDRRIRVALGIWFIPFLGVVAWQFLHHPEPNYDGKPLTTWLQEAPMFFEEAEDKTSPSGRAAIAIRHIGTNAVPYLIQSARLKDSFLKRFIASALPWPQSIPPIFRPAKETREMAVFGFYALGSMGKDAVPALIELLKDRDTDVRYHAARSLGYIGGDAEPAIPQLLLLVDHTNRVIAWTAMSSLGMIRRKPFVVVPLLITNLLSTNAILYDRTILALGDFGEQARAASPFILPFLNDADEVTRWDTTNVLKRIDPEAAAKAGIE
jgi:HEAT repeat protein